MAIIAKRLIPSDTGDIFPFKFQITTTAANTVFTVPLVDYAGLTPQVTISWGDGSGNSPLITSSTSNDRIHTYSTAGTYTITIAGLLPGFSVYNNSSIRNLITGIIQFGTVGLRTLNFYGCVNLTSIPSSASLSALGGYEGLDEMISFASFMRSTRISSIPADMFDYSPNATTFTDCFGLNPSLTTVPSGLFDSVTGATTFANCFLGCSTLTSVPSTLFDTNINVLSFAGLFRNCLQLTNVLQFTFNTAVTNFSNVYNMSTVANALTGTAPELWNRTPIPLGTNAFNNCTGLSNFASIPSTWT